MKGRPKTGDLSVPRSARTQLGLVRQKSRLSDYPRGDNECGIYLGSDGYIYIYREDGRYHPVRSNRLIYKANYKKWSIHSKKASLL